MNRIFFSIGVVSRTWRFCSPNQTNELNGRKPSRRRSKSWQVPWNAARSRSLWYRCRSGKPELVSNSLVPPRRLASNGMSGCAIAMATSARFAFWVWYRNQRSLAVMVFAMRESCALHPSLLPMIGKYFSIKTLVNNMPSKNTKKILGFLDGYQRELNLTPSIFVTALLVMQMQASIFPFKNLQHP